MDACAARFSNRLPAAPRPSPHLLPPFFFSSTSSWVPFCPACGLVCAVRARGCRSRAQVRLGTLVLVLRRRGCRPASRFGAPSPIVSVSARPCLCACLCACVSFRPPGRPHPLFFFLPHCSGCRWRSAICLTGWSGTGGSGDGSEGEGFSFCCGVRGSALADRCIYSLAGGWQIKGARLSCPGLVFLSSFLPVRTFLLFPLNYLLFFPLALKIASYHHYRSRLSLLQWCLQLTPALLTT